MSTYAVFVNGLFKRRNSTGQDLEHAALGIAGEAGELIDAIKKHAIYGKPLDRVNIVEELGDLRFYMQALMNTLGISEEEIIRENMRKLSARYPRGIYSDEQAIARADKQGE